MTPGDTIDRINAVAIGIAPICATAAVAWRRWTKDVLAVLVATAPDSDGGPDA